MRIFKYPLPERTTGSYNLHLPVGATIVSFAYQHEAFVLYALVDPMEQVVETRPVRLCFTGDIVDSSDKFIGTVQVGGFVFHLFEVL